MDLTRQPANIKIAQIIMDYIYSYPDLRFNQILSALEVTLLQKDESGHYSSLKDLFYEESTITLERVKKAHESIGKI